MQITTNLFLYFVIFCIGASIGALIERALKRRSAPPQPVPPSVNQRANEGDVEVLSAWRTRDNQVWLDMDGNRLESKAALQPKQYQRLLSLVLDLRPWLETARPAAARPETALPPVRLAVPTATSAPQPVRPVAPFIPAPPQQLQPETRKGPFVVEKVKPAPVLDSIIQQIDRVLQAKLATSAFIDRGIQLIEGPGGIVIVKDGINRYEGVDGIPDPEIKTLIRQAVADWEKGAR